MSAHEFTDESAARYPRQWSRRVGDITVHYLPDAEIELVPTRFINGSTEDDWAAVPHRLTEDGYLAAGAGAFLVDSGGEFLVIDAGFGPVSVERDQTAPYLGAMRSGRLPNSFAAAGVDPADVGTVAFTHLHPDHMGWACLASVADGRSLFPNARWLVGHGERHGAHRSATWVLADEQNRTAEVVGGYEPVPGVRSWALPGHTTGHTSWIIDGGSEKLIVFGDVMHSPAQVEHPDWEVRPDADGDAAERSRRDLIEVLSGPDVLGVGVHFADQQVGRVDQGRWVPPELVTAR